MQNAAQNDSPIYTVYDGVGSDNTTLIVFSAQLDKHRAAIVIGIEAFNCTASLPFLQNPILELFSLSGIACVKYLLNLME